MTIYKSNLPSIDLPVTDTYSLVFEKNNLPDSQIALIDSITQRKITRGELKRDIQRLASGLRNNLHLDRAVVAFLCPNDVQYPVIMFGIVRAGCTISPMNPGYTPVEIAYQVKDSGAKYLVTHVAGVAMALEAAKFAGLASSNVIVLGDEPVAGQRCVKDIVSDKPLSPLDWTQEELRDRPAYLCYSSGTTGRSKGVMSSHHNITSNILQYTAACRAFGHLGENDVWASPLPNFHIFALTMSHAGLYMGIPLVVFPKFDLLLYLEALQREKVTYSHLVPPILIGLAKHPAVDKFDLSSLKFLMSGAAPLGPELAQAVAKRLNVTVLQGWGMTETSPVVHVVRDTKTPLGSCGELIPNCEARVVDPDTGKDVAKGERGELWVRGPMVMVGYHNNAQATADTIDKDMWLHTGDVVYVDKSGNFYVVDRIKELIKYKGFQVPPAELEAYLLEHPDIADAAVISRPCEVAGELPRAFVVCREGTKLTEKDVIGFIDGKVTNYKRLRGGVAFVSEIPKAASGKILRRVLRDQDKIAMEAEKASTASRL